MKKKSKIVFISVGILIGLIFILPFIVQIFEPWSEINCWHHDINIKTGKTRYSRYFWFIKFEENITDTWLSKSLHGETVDVATIDEWHHVYTFSPDVSNSPHYYFHGALCQVDDFEFAAEEYNFTPERKKVVAKNILTAWQQSGDDKTVLDYYVKVIGEETLKE